jgi:hypothetical protein
MKMHTKIWTTLLVVGVATAVGASIASAQNGQIQQRVAPRQAGPQQGAPRQAAPQQGVPQQGAPQQVAPQGAVRQSTTVTTGAQTQVTAKVVEGGIGLADIGICHGKRFDCNHVINQLLRRRHQRHFGGGIIKPAPIVHRGFYGDHVVQPVLSDLQLVSVGMVNPGDAEHAPIFGITICNHGNVELYRFNVSAVAVLGEIHQFSPTATIKIDRILPGETITVEVQMPFAALAMDNLGHRNPFDTLIVAIDAYDQIMECNELNNILILKRTAIVVVEARTETTVEETTTTETISTPAIGNNVQAAPAPAAPAPDQRKPSPLDSIDLDKLDLSGESEATGLLSFEGSPF